MDRERLARRIREVAYLEGEFTLRSGQKSNYYLDKYRFETQPDILKALGALLAEHVLPETSVIAGAELGGVALAAAVSMASNRPFVIVRNAKKDYGTGNVVEGAVAEADRVLLVEDVATTGGQVLEAANVLVGLGAAVEKIVAVVDRGQGAGDNIQRAGFAFDALFGLSDLGIAAAGGAGR